MTCRKPRKLFDGAEASSAAAFTSNAANNSRNTRPSSSFRMPARKPAAARKKTQLMPRPRCWNTVNPLPGVQSAEERPTTRGRIREEARRYRQAEWLSA